MKKTKAINFIQIVMHLLLDVVSFLDTMTSEQLSVLNVSCLVLNWIKLSMSDHVNI